MKSYLTLLEVVKVIQNGPVGDLICPRPRRAPLQMNHVSVIHILPTAVCYEEDRLGRGGRCCKSSFAAAAERSQSASLSLRLGMCMCVHKSRISPVMCQCVFVNATICVPKCVS